MSYLCKYHNLKSITIIGRLNILIWGYFISLVFFVIYKKIKDALTMQKFTGIHLSTPPLMDHQLKVRLSLFLWICKKFNSTVCSSHKLIRGLIFLSTNNKQVSVGDIILKYSTDNKKSRSQWIKINN